MVLLDRGAVRAVMMQSIAYAQKEISQQLRFKFDFLANLLVYPLINLGLFSTVFFGFLRQGAAHGAELNISNFISFTVLGALASSIFTQSFQSFISRFQSEKYWQTAQGLFASPLSPWAILFGAAISDWMGVSIIMAFLLSIAYFTSPIPIYDVFGVVLMYVLLYMMSAGVSIIRGSLFLANENFSPFFSYFMLGTAYVSCFYYPVSFLPSFFQIFAMINPVYYVIASIRSLWLGYQFSVEYAIVAVLVAILTTTVGTYLFGKIWRNLDISGY